MTKKNTGGIDTVTFKLSEPMKFEFENMAMKNISIYVGQNGTGKTLVLIMTWLLSHIMQSLVQMGGKKAPINLMHGLTQFSMDHTFTAPVTGTIKGVFSSGAWLSIDVNKSKLTGINFEIPDDINDPIRAIYMSTNIRLFSAIKSYMVLRKMIGPASQEELFQKLLEHYKLYDVLYIEQLIQKMPIKVDSRMKQSLEGFDIKEDILQFEVDTDKADFYAVINETDAAGEFKRKSLSQMYSNGHQSLFNMMLANV